MVHPAQLFRAGCLHKFVFILWYKMSTYLYRIYRGFSEYLNRPAIDTSQNIIQCANDFQYTILHPALFYVNHVMEKSEIYKLVSDNKHFCILRFQISPFYSSYLFCYWILDLMDILSNELFFVESKIEIYPDPESHSVYMKEFKDFIRKNIPSLQRNKILPIYAKFLIDPDFHIEYSVNFGTRFHILFIKENLDHLIIQRIHFNIDL